MLVFLPHAHHSQQVLKPTVYFQNVQLEYGRKLSDLISPTLRMENTFISERDVMYVGNQALLQLDSARTRPCSKNGTSCRYIIKCNCN